MEQQRGRPRIADVAREAGVSKTAVSFAFNSPERLSPDTATRIREVADSLGYRPHPVARMLTQRRTRTLGVLTPQALSVVFANPFFATFSEGVAAAAEEAGYGLLFVSPVYGSLARAVGRATVDGFVAIGLSEEHPEVGQIRRADLPIVLVDSSAFPEHAAVDVDDEGGARQAAEHLLALGHREFLVVGVEPPTPGAHPDFGGVVGRRLAGYRAAFAEDGVELPDDRVVVGPASIDGGAACFTRAWEDGLRPTAVLAMSDAMAIGVIGAARRLGLAVPADVSVVGFDDIELARHVDPPLTTVRQPVRRKGEEACRLLLAAIERGDGAGPEHRRLETRLIVRGSSGPAPRRGREVAAGD
ncbi:MAG: LacI family DNA-binding transcriptional regulator [Chloroflexi bacterium]|nr:LacI family DNA-binding transcriptional regulator [Chloroflexota bacterium]